MIGENNILIPELMNYSDLKNVWHSDTDYISCHTSGSTGEPTEIELPKSQMRASAIRTNTFFNIGPASLLYSCISPNYIGGKMMLIRSEISGCRFKYEEPSNRPLSNFGKQEVIDLLSVVPSQMNHILDNLDDLPQINNILVGGAPIPLNIRKRISESGLCVYESYGMTETSSHIALRKVDMLDKPFRTLEGISVEECEGKLKITIEGWNTFMTNDSPLLINSREFHILGRVDNIINSGGIKINPEQLESKLSRHILQPFAISSIPDEKWGEAIVLVIESDRQIAVSLQDIIENELSRYERPKHIFTIDSLPRTANGKIQRKQLKEYCLDKIRFT